MYPLLLLAMGGLILTLGDVLIKQWLVSDYSRF